ncbi:RING finger protein 212B [Pimephales promelas]|nr:RING finger protein 212B [Pimephales promelas]
MMDRASGMDRIMSHWICCNSCFMSPGNERQLAVTSCGHIICNVCFQRGNQGVCLICKANCQISALSDKSSSEVQDFFLDINAVAVKYFSDISKVLQFQATHQKRLLAHYQQKIERMKEDELKIQQEMQKMAKKISEQNAYISKLEMTVQNQSSRLAFQSNRDLPSASQRQASSVTKVPYSSPLLMSRSISSASLFSSSQGIKSELYGKPFSAIQCHCQELAKLTGASGRFLALHVDICKTYVKRCMKCQTLKNDNRKPAGKIQQTTTSRPNEMLGVDIMGPLPRSSHQHEYLLVFVDYYSWWVELFPFSAGADAGEKITLSITKSSARCVDKNPK